MAVVLASHHATKVKQLVEAARLARMAHGRPVPGKTFASMRAVTERTAGVHWTCPHMQTI